MAGRLASRMGVRKSVLWLSMAMLGLMTLAGSSCNPKQNAPEPSAKKASPSTPKASDLQPVIDQICQGDFKQAQQLLAEMPADPAVEQIAQLVDHYFRIEDRRNQKRQDAFVEQLDELEKIKEKVAASSTPGIPDVNDMDETMLTVIRAREFANDDQKEVLLNDPFVQNVLETTKANAANDEQRGKWLDAYAHCYYWLTAIFEEDSTYQDKVDELIELAAIELAFKDSSCGETAAERYEGIESAMFLRALQLLDGNYVHEIDCRLMIVDSLERCRLLGQVLAKTEETLAWVATETQTADWDTKIKALQSRYQSPLQGSTEADIKTIASVLEEVLDLNETTLKLPDTVVIAHFSEAALGSLDPFTNMVWPWNVKDFEKSMTQQFTGIGVEISNSTGVLRVVSLLPDTPAYKSGLDAEDEIIAVNGELTKEMSILCAVSKITGPKGTKVTLTIRRPSTGETQEMTITRDKIVVQPLRGWTRDASSDWDHLIDPENKIGYLRLTAFTETSAPDIDAELRKLEKNGLNGLILDLRFNSGGFLQSSADIVDMFVSEGLIVKSSPRQGMATYEIAHRKGTHPNYPLVILINGSSASASEIVAGALQDPEYKRATLVGRRSYGKGSVQVVTPFTGGGSQLKYTIAYYHLPSNQRVKNRYEMEKEGRTDWGIAPDVEVELTSNEIKEMIDIQRGNDVLTRMDHEANGGSTNRHVILETLQFDPQLSIGLLVVQSKLIAQGVTLNLDAMSATETTTTESAKNNK